MAKLPPWATDLGLLVLRAALGAMMLVEHGLPKLLTFSERMHRFPDPLGVGSPASLSLAIVGEVFASGLLAIGLGTRAAAIPFLVTMLVAALVVHAGDPLSDRELALLYAAGALTVLLVGPGRLSLDGWIAKRRTKTADAK